MERVSNTGLWGPARVDRLCGLSRYEFCQVLKVEPSRWQLLASETSQNHLCQGQGISGEIVMSTIESARVRTLIAFLFPTTEGVD